MAENRSDKASADAPDRGRAGWDQVARQDQLHWTEGNTDQNASPAPPPGEDHDRNATLSPPRSDDGFAEYQATKDDDTPDSNWDEDDYRRTEFAGSRDGTSHPTHPPDVNGEPQHMLPSD